VRHWACPEYFVSISLGNACFFAQQKVEKCVDCAWFYCIWIKGSITYIQKIGRMIHFGVFMYWLLSSLFPGHETQPPLVILTRKITSTKELPNVGCALYLGTSKVHENYMESRGTHYNWERIIFKKLRCKLVCQPCRTQCVILFTPWLVISSG